MRFFIALFLGVLCWPAYGLAAINLSVMPSDGSNSLRLKDGSSGFANKQEVRIRVVSTDNKRFQIFQRVAGTLINEKGQSLNLQAIETQSLPNSNSAGTLYLQSPQRLSLSEELLYTSPENAQSDSFILGYGLRPELLNGTGQFRGRIIFTARAAGDSDSQSAIDVVVDVQSKWSASIKGSRNPQQVQIAGADAAKSTDFVQVSFSGNTGQEVRIYQELNVLPQNESAEALESDAIRMDAAGGHAAVRIPSQVNPGRTLIYTSRESEDSFQLYYSLDPAKLPQLEPGHYNGRMKYIVESVGGNQQDFEIDLQCQIQPIFSMEIVPPAEGLNFSHVLPQNPPQVKEFEIIVHSNLRRPYQVLHSLQGPMTNEKGKEFDSKYFTFRVDIPSSQKGRTKFNDLSSVQTGEYPVYSSDKNGSPATFKVVYQLQGYPQMNSGEFRVPIRFSLNEN